MYNITIQSYKSKICTDFYVQYYYAKLKISKFASAKMPVNINRLIYFMFKG